MNHVDLFSGIGGFALAAQWTGFETVVFCEKDKFCQKVLRKHWPEVPIIPEIRDFDGTKWRGATLLTGGFPCQPFSCAGKQRGKEDDRYLWPEMLKVIKETEPHWILAENVPGIFRMALDDVLADLESEGYTTGTLIIPACGLNAPHRRNRIWILGNSISSGLPGKHRGRAEKKPKKGCKILANSEGRRIQGKSISIRQRQSQETTCNINRSGQNVADANCSRQADIQGSSEDEGSTGNRTPCDSSWWNFEPDVGRVAYGIPDRVDRLKALGNAIVPQIATEIMRGIKMIEEGSHGLE